MTPDAAHAAEIQAGERFPFGDNWRRFLSLLDEPRIVAAEHSLLTMLERSDLHGVRFLDAGSGSGLFSLAARRLGAHVHSFDFDPASVACTAELRRRYFDGNPDWRVTTGSVLDGAFMETMGQFDVVYSWGVLHHTGSMELAFDRVAGRVSEGGQLFIAIYNDQRWISRYWLAVKRIYNRSRVGRWAMVATHAPYLLGLRWLVRAVSGRSKVERGMSLRYDMLDWLGGYPFEVARPEAVLAHFRRHGFVLERMVTCGGRMGCNEFVFRRRAGTLA